MWDGQKLQTIWNVHSNVIVRNPSYNNAYSAFVQFTYVSIYYFNTHEPYFSYFFRVPCHAYNGKNVILCSRSFGKSAFSSVPKALL